MVLLLLNLAASRVPSPRRICTFVTGWLSSIAGSYGCGGGVGVGVRVKGRPNAGSATLTQRRPTWQHRGSPNGPLSHAACKVHWTTELARHHSTPGSLDSRLPKK